MDLRRRQLNDFTDQGGFMGPDIDDDLSTQVEIIPVSELSDSSLPPAAIRQLIADAGIDQHYDVLLLALLIQSNKLKPENLATFLEEARTQEDDIPTHAIKSGIAEDNDLNTVTARLYGMEPVALSRTNIEADITTLISSEDDSGIAHQDFMCSYPSGAVSSR